MPGQRDASLNQVPHLIIVFERPLKEIRMNLCGISISLSLSSLTSLNSHPLEDRDSLFTMLRQTARSFGALSITDNPLSSGQLSRPFSSRPKFFDSNTEEDEIGSVQKWVANLSSNPIPESIASFTSSRASGSGGQHVNKCVVSRH